MLTYEDIKNFYIKSTLNDDMKYNYDRRQFEQTKQNYDIFCEFLAVLNIQLSKIGFSPFYKTMASEITRNIYKSSMDEDLIYYFNILDKTSKPKTTDHKILTSLEFQMKEAMHKSYNEYSYEEKFILIFYIILNKFDLGVQKQFLKLLKKFNFNSSLDLLVMLTHVKDYMDGNTTLDKLENDISYLTTFRKTIGKNGKSLIIETSHGSIPLFNASERLGLNKDELFQKGKCHFAVSKYLKLFPDFYGAYYYIPNYFKGFIEHSVLIDYSENYVYDLSHNIALPLEYFSKYYNNLSFVIKGSDFIKLNYLVKHKYHQTIYMHHIEEVKRQLEIKRN